MQLIPPKSRENEWFPLSSFLWRCSNVGLSSLAESFILFLQLPFFKKRWPSYYAREEKHDEWQWLTSLRKSRKILFFALAIWGMNSMEKNLSFGLCHLQILPQNPINKEPFWFHNYLNGPCKKQPWLFHDELRHWWLISQVWHWWSRTKTFDSSNGCWLLWANMKC